MRLGVYADIPYFSDGNRITADVAFVVWLSALSRAVDELVLFGRLTPGRGSHAIDAPNLRFVGLPHYVSLRAPMPVVRSLRGTVRAWQEELVGLDAVLIFGPHPVGLVLGAVARRRHVPVIVGVRQDFPVYLRTRITGWPGHFAGLAGRVLEFGHRRLGRRYGAVVVGEQLGARYGPRALVTGVSLVDQADLRPSEPAGGSESTLRALAVTRLDPEKNPLLLVDVLYELRRIGPWTLDVAGDGPLRSQLLAAAAERGVSNWLHVHGHVDSQRLWELYRSALVLVHTAWTEGLPQVLYEAAAARVAIVGTAVGGVPAALAHGRRGMLVGPGDALGLAQAADQLAKSPALRQQLTAAAFEWSAGETTSSQTERVARFIAERAGLAVGRPSR